ncbi:hypothetical protein [Mariniphaga sediminis]|uniref:hypothetical protein n=1 Tax=Mariniphaga sediminis TaxID=1628158 RepID=UPI0035618514
MAAGVAQRTGKNAKAWSIKLAGSLMPYLRKRYSVRQRTTFDYVAYMPFEERTMPFNVPFIRDIYDGR